jgi:hypothetical protein
MGITEVDLYSGAQSRSGGKPTLHILECSREVNNQALEERSVESVERGPSGLPSKPRRDKILPTVVL